MAPLELRMSFPDLAAFERELAQNLTHGRALLPEAADLAVLSDCTLVLVHPEQGGELRLPAQVVMVSASGPICGTGIELRPFGPAVLAQIEAFARAQPLAAVAEPQDGSSEAHGSELQAPADTPLLEEAQDARRQADAPAQDELGFDATADDAADDAALDAEVSRELAGKSIPPDVQLQSKQEKLRHLTAADQVKLARTGELSDRLTIERLYGKQVWEALLHNPRLTIPEVARIARKGTVPKPLLEVILENAGWIKAPQVRRALLGNPKVSADAIGKLLRSTPRHELKLIDKGTAYAMPVREAARKLLKQ
ncbi:MAG TPA: hypothetical protein VF331_21540 [Polyangiales bacterium]